MEPPFIDQFARLWASLGAFVLWLAQSATPPAWLGLFTCLLDVGS